MAEIVAGNPVNDASEKHVNTHSTLDLSYNLAQTLRYGEYSPCFAMEVCPKDSIPYRLRHTLRSFSLQSPLMENVRLNKDFFFIPAECILPLNWDKVYTNPVHGDDVNASLVGCTVQDFPNLMRNFFNCAVSEEADYIEKLLDETEGYSDEFALGFYLKILFAAQMIFSNGSLLAQLGCPLHSLVRLDPNYWSSPTFDSFDKFFDDQMSGLGQVFDYFVFQDGDVDRVCEINAGSYTGSYPVFTLRQFMEYAMDDFGWSVVSMSAYKNGNGAGSFDLSGLIFDKGVVDDSGMTFPLNLARFWSYQIVCAHYFSNDKVDYIYTADLFRQNVTDCLLSLEGVAGITSPNEFFTLNGSSFRYDSLSAYNFVDVLSNFADDPSFSGFSSVFQYLRLIFGFNRSLRYVDYFTGSKTQPLAVGNVNVGVVSSQVNVVDITQNIQKQRFLNAVNRFGRRISEYVKGMFGVSQAPDYHNPFFLSHTSDYIGNQEIESTAGTSATQFSEDKAVSTILRSNSERFEFTFDADRVGILLGVESFDLRRYYYQGVERLMTHTDRYEMFNPFMQFTGDQPVYGYERDVKAVSHGFAYQLKYAEYKQRVSRACGGFIEYLPSWIPLAEEGQYSESVVHQGPRFIRSRPSEFDKFFPALTNYSLAGYFHFIIVNENLSECKRPMAYAPSIL